ncbi:MAG TPA: tetratricopeptide repeat protein [Terriglobales bacterium]
METSPRIGLWLLVFALAVVARPLHADQESKPTVRHHRVEDPADDSTSPEIDQAETAMQKQDYVAAETLLLKALASNPNAYRAWFDLGYIYTSTKHVPEAVVAYRKSVEAKPDVFESNLNLGILLARKGENAEAAKYLKAATQLKPTANTDEGLARAWLSLGLIEEASDPQQALAAYAQAAKLTPNDPEPHLSTGQVLEKQNKFDEAAREYQAAAKLDPKSTQAMTGLANIYSKQKKYAEAETQLRKLVAIEPDNSNARVQLGRVLAAEGKTDEAAAFMSAEQSASSDDPHAALERGTMYVKAGKNAEAEQQFRIAVQGLPQDAEAHFALGSVLMHEKQYPESQAELLAAAKLKPDMAEIYGNLAVVAGENKNYELAIKALDERAKFLPEAAGTYFLRATSYDYLKVTAKAVENYQRFLATDDGKMPNQEWQARHRLIAIDPSNASKYVEKK